ncbi:MAG: GGDEF domain-containing protein [Granulicella sp.]
MDLSTLPSFYALAVFVFCFRPLVRRAGQYTDVWFFGWAFLLIHYAVLLVPQKTGFAQVMWELLAVWSTELCALCFLWAASNGRPSRFNRIFVLELGVPVLLQSGLSFLWPGEVVLRSAAALLFLLPGIHLLMRRKYRTTPFEVLASVFALLGLVLVVFRAIDSYLVVGIVLGMIFVSAAYFTFVRAATVTLGVVLMIVGLVLWGITCPLQSIGVLDPMSILPRGLMELPRYVLAAGMILSFLDEYVTRQERLALHDPLTGLPNRRLFEERMDEAIAESARTGTPVACLVIDVDKFKYINDTFGHPVGDGLLQALAKRLSWNLGPRDMLARTGGDEFTAVIVEAADEYHVRFIAGAMMAAGCVPVSIKQHSIDVHISIGIALSPQDADGSNELHKAADDAMYRAKRHGGGVIAFAGEELPQIHMAPALHL